MLTKPRYLPGERIGGRYEVHRALMGGMGEVYLCLDIEENLPFALKTFQARYLKPDKLRDAFTREVSTWVALEKHPNIVRCHFMDFIDEQPFMFLEWIAGNKYKGTDLRSWLRYGPLDIRLAMNFITDICRGLIHANQKQLGIVHRDLKPENILIAVGEIAKITDFGLATIVQDIDVVLSGKEKSTNGCKRLVHNSGIVGTPPYMAPEQWLCKEIDVRTDIYAVGCILYEILTGRLPFKADTFEDYQNQHLNAEIPEISKEGILFDSLNTILSRCLMKEKDDRFSTINNLMEELVKAYERQFKRSPKKFEVIDTFTALDYSNRGGTYWNLKLYNEALKDLNRAIQLDPEDPHAYVNRGVVYKSQKEYEKAFSDYRHAININPSLIEAYINLGSIHEELKQNDDTISAYTRALELDPSLDKVYINRGNIYLKQNHLKEALSDFNRAIEIRPNSSEAYSNRGVIYDETNKYDEAFSDFNKAIKIDSENAKAYSNRGKHYFKKKQYNNSLTDLNRAIEIDPSLVEAYVNRGNTYKELKRYDKALSDFTKAIELNPNLAQAYSNRGPIYEDMKQFDKALADYDRALKIDPNLVEIYINRNATLCAMMRFDEALSDINHAIDISPNNAVAYMNRANTYVMLQRYNEALSDFNKAVELEPDNSQIYYNRAKLYEMSQQFNQALSDYSCAIEIDTNNVWAYTNRGYIYTILNQFDEALDDFSKAIEIEPTHIRAYINRGTLYLQLAQYDKAITNCTTAIKIDPNNFEAFTNRGAAYYQLRRFDEALLDFQKGIRLNPNNFMAHRNIGVIKYKHGKLQEALQYFENAAKLGDIEGQKYYEKVQGLLSRTNSSSKKSIKNSSLKELSQVINSILCTNSLDEMERVVKKFPFIKNHDFIAQITISLLTPQELTANAEVAFKEVLKYFDVIQKLSNERRVKLQERLKWLTQILMEQK